MFLYFWFLVLSVSYIVGEPPSGWNRWSVQLRLAARAFLLVVLATCRGVMVSLEQPGSSTMKFFPDLVRTGKLINQQLGSFWKEQFLSDTQSYCPGVENCFNGFQWIIKSTLLSFVWFPCPVSAKLDGYLGITQSKTKPLLGHRAGSQEIDKCFAWSFSTCNTSFVSSAFQGHGCLPCIGPLLRSKENNWQNEQRSWRLPSSVVSVMGPFLCPHLSWYVDYI